MKRYSVVNTMFEGDTEKSSYLTLDDSGKYVEYDDRAMLEEAVKIIESLQDGLLPYENESGIMRVKLHCWRDLKSFLSRAKGRLDDKDI